MQGKGVLSDYFDTASMFYNLSMIKLEVILIFYFVMVIFYLPLFVFNFFYFWRNQRQEEESVI